MKFELNGILRVLLLGLALWAVACKKPAEPLVSRSQTFAELRTIQRGVFVTLPDEKERKPYFRERLVDGEAVRVEAGGLAWIRRDGGATLLVSGPARLRLRAQSLEVSEGRIFVDTPGGVKVGLSTPRGGLNLSAVRASIEVSQAGDVSAYVLRGAVRLDGGAQAGPGERITVGAGGKTEKAAVTAWEDWTGGLATTDRAAEPAPFGVGTIGARKPGDRGQPRFPLSIQRLDVRVTIDGEFATTEVDQIFANPTSDTVEGIFAFRTPEGAALARFGVDRDETLVWGRVKEKQAAAAQYQAHVYEGSREDPALLEWNAPGVYKARLYPIEPRETRRVVTRYSEWLGRHGAHGERRLYVYPMAAEGAEGTLPRIEEMTVTLDLERARASEVRIGMNGKQEGSIITVKAHDFVPRADLSVELFDGGAKAVTAYRADHGVDRETTPADELEKAEKAAKDEAPYLLVPIRAPKASDSPGGVDLGIVIDTSAATSPWALSIARALSAALLAHLGPEDRAAVWAGDATLRAVADGSDGFAAMNAKRRDAVVTGLAQVERGGATDIGALLSDAASRLDTSRRGALVYIGDGRPTVGELGIPELRQRLARLPQTVRLFGIGVGDEANMQLLSSVARGGFSVRVGDAHAAGRAALHVLEEATRPVWLGASVDLGPGVDRVFPRELGALTADEPLLVVGRVVGPPPKQITLRGSGLESTEALTVRALDDDGDLRRRWAEGRLGQLLEEGSGRAAVVEVGVRSGIITPFTSLYVPTADERRAELDRADRVAAESGGPRSWWRWLWAGRRDSYEPEAAVAMQAYSNEEAGTRAKGEEGAMGKASARPEPEAEAAPAPQRKRYAVQGPRDDAARRADALKEAMEFGTIGQLSAPAPSSMDDVSAAGNMWGDEIGDAFGAGGLGLSGRGEGGGGIGLGSIGTLGHGSGTGTGQGSGSGQGQLGASHRTAPAPKVHPGAPQVTGSLPPEVIQRIVRQNLGRFRRCYEQGLRKNPSLQGRISVRFAIKRDGSVSNVSTAGSDLPDSEVIQCVIRGFHALSFPEPESGIVTVVYPIDLGDATPVTPKSAGPPPKPSPPRTATADPPPRAVLGAIGHHKAPCPPSADLPFEERRNLWLERLRGSGGNVELITQVYFTALNHCEAPTFRERSHLLILAVNTLVGIRPRIELWGRFLRQGTMADVIYRTIMTRVRTADDIRELHEALGIRELDRSVLDKALSQKKSPEERSKLLEELARKWPDDIELQLMLLDALEDAGDDGAGRALARRLRRRADATTRVRTSVGEYYLRLAAQGEGPAAERDRVEARRTFGEIVEFAPDDPWARRLLGDLLRAHGWYEEAFRQYETLAKLAPDDPSVPLLLAAAAQGMGRTEEAIRWTEKAAATGAPDPTSPLSKTSRSLASAFLAWAREEAGRAGRKEEAQRLRERARRLTAVDIPEAGAARLILTWAHPELHPELWSNALGSPMPASDGDAALGVLQTLLPGSLAERFVELHLSRDDAERAARLGAEAVLTAIFDEGTETEKIVRLAVPFSRVSGKAPEKRRFVLAAGALREEVL